METQEILKKVRKIEIKTRGLSAQLFSGHYHTIFKGRGMAFSEVREYQYGDDVRTIDWNVSARLNHPYVKIFEEERELTVMLLIDVSASNLFGTNNQLKQELITEIAAVLSFSAIQNNDKVGVIFFSDKIEKFIPPKKGTSHILRIIRTLVDFKPENKKTDITVALRYFTNVIKKRCTAFILSDFMSSDFSEAMKIANRKHDLIAVRMFDKRESVLPDVGLLKTIDPENGMENWIDTSDMKLRVFYEKNWKQRESIISDSFIKSGVDMVTIETGRDYIAPLISLFKKRERRF